MRKDSKKPSKPTPARVAPKLPAINCTDKETRIGSGSVQTDPLLFFRSYSAYLLDFPVFWGLAVCFALPERFALPVCTTVVPLLFPEAAPNAAPAAAPLATGWVFCCSSAGGGGGGGCSCGGCCAVGGCWAGGGCCDEACGAIAIVTATAVTTSMNVLKAIILPPNRLLCSGSQSVGEAYVSYDPSCSSQMHCRDNYTYYRAA